MKQKRSKKVRENLNLEMYLKLFFKYCYCETTLGKLKCKANRFHSKTDYRPITKTTETVFTEKKGNQNISHNSSAQSVTSLFP